MSRSCTHTIATIAGVLLLTYLPACCATLRVPTQYLSIEAALGDAAPGDTVLVSPGTYDECNLSVPDGVLLLGTPGNPSSVVIDAQGGGRVLLLTGCTSATRVIGFTITGGATDETLGGAGVLCDDYASPMLQDLVISGNQAEWNAGGLLIAWHSSPELLRVTFDGNHAGHYGGGIYMTNYCYPLLTDVDFVGNSAVELGGALCCRKYTDPQITGCTFTGNTCPGGLGGGAYFYSSTSPTIQQSEFRDNQSYSGGGIFADGVFSVCTLVDVLFMGNSASYAGGGLACYDNSAVLASVTFSGNEAGEYGGALYLEESDAGISDVVLWSNHSDRYGGALYCWESSPVITSTTFALNGAQLAGGTVYCRNISHPAFYSSILAFSSLCEAVYCENSAGNCEPTLECCDIYGNVGGDWVGCITDYSGIHGNFSSDPLFCDIEGGDLQIDTSSPCTAILNPECGLVGAEGTGCDSPVYLGTSWGTIKARYLERR